jgi:hypothetical protein
MVRRNRRSGARPQTATDRLPSFRSHWRVDGSAKTAYRTQRDALAVADERRQDTDVRLAAYRCELCTAWHLGNVRTHED